MQRLLKSASRPFVCAHKSNGGRQTAVDRECYYGVELKFIEKFQLESEQE